MNIFVLHKDPKVAAQYMVDRHVIKMILESAQLLCSVFPEGEAPYKRTHYNHPCAKWVRESKQNYLWVVRHALALNEEYKYRWDRSRNHASVKVIQWCIERMNDLSFARVSRTPFVLAMPEECRVEDPIEAYRIYYKQHKSHIAVWKKREQPEWWR